MVVHAAVEERRREARIAFQGRIELQMPQRAECLQADSINLSEGGLCVRVRELLDIRSAVSLRLFPQRIKRPLECEGRIAWVMQRLDLSAAPPFLYDVGVEFTRTPSRLRQFVSRLGGAVHPAIRSTAAQASHPSLSPMALRGRSYQPQLAQDAPPQDRWHLVVVVDGVPCFSRRYASRQEGVEAWKSFKRDLQRQAPIGASR